MDFHLIFQQIISDLETQILLFPSENTFIRFIYIDYKDS